MNDQSQSLREISEFFHKAAMAAAASYNEHEALWWVPPLEPIVTDSDSESQTYLLPDDLLMTLLSPISFDGDFPQNFSESTTEEEQPCLENQSQNQNLFYSALTPMSLKPVYVFSIVTVTKSDESSSSSSSSSPTNHCSLPAAYDFGDDSYKSFGFLRPVEVFEADFHGESHVSSVNEEETKPIVMSSTTLMKNQSENFLADPNQRASLWQVLEQVSEGCSSSDHVGSEF